MKLRFLLFFTMVLVVFGTEHYYVWRRIARDTNLSSTRRKQIGWCLALLFVITILGIVFTRVLQVPWLGWLSWISYGWMGTIFFLCAYLFIGDLIYCGTALVKRMDRSPINHSRRRFFKRSISSGAVAAAGLTATFSAGWAMMRTVVRRVDVQLDNLHPVFDGFRIVQISDLHIGPILRRNWLQGVVDKVNELKPDLIAITGDLVDGSVESLREHVAPLAQLQAPYGTFFCTGNHEYYSGAVEWCAEVNRMGIRVLRNEHVLITKDSARLQLAGIDDHRARGRAPGHGSDIPKAVSGCSKHHPIILMAHQPVSVHEATKNGVHFQISGHTHGGQIWPFHWLVRLSQPYVSGLNMHETTQIYVNQGTGFWGPPMRLGSTSEITEITLQRSETGQAPS